MTDKEKQIEEIARTIHYDYWGACDADSCSDCWHSDLNICKDKIIAEKLYNKLFPEGSVVLSKEEYEELQKGVKTHNYTAMFNASQEARILELEKRLCNIAYEARKETAREILKELYEQIDEKTPKWVETQIKMKAEQFCVEVEE